LGITKDNNLICVLNSREPASLYLCDKGVSADHTFHVTNFTPHNPAINGGARFKKMSEPGFFCHGDAMFHPSKIRGFWLLGR
jgi:hypothetical protein